MSVPSGLDEWLGLTPKPADRLMHFQLSERENDENRMHEV
jgi:hypothetical protein